MSIKGIIDQENLRAIAARACDEDEESSVELIDHCLEPYSKSTVGFLGNHQKLRMTVKRKESSEPVKLNFFVKSVPCVSAEQTSFVKQCQVFNQEAEFFNRVMPQLLEAAAIGAIEPWAPKCYMANDNVLVLEDVRCRGYETQSAKVLEGSILKSAVRSLARLHGASIVAEKRLGNAINELYPRACVEQIFKEAYRDRTTPLYKSLIKDVAKKNELSIEGLDEALDRVFNYVNHGRAEQRVVCHGDAWPNNLMLDYSKEPPACLLVDYQIVRYAPRAYDIAQLIYLSTSQEVRMREEKETIGAYWGELSEVLRRCDPSVDRPTLERLYEEYEEARLAAQLVAIIYYPTILLSKDVLTEYENDPSALYKKFVFRRNNDGIIEQMDKDKEYGRRITELVLEFLNSCRKLSYAGV